MLGEVYGHAVRTRELDLDVAALLHLRVHALQLGADPHVAVLPAVLYYVGVYSQVHFRALRFGMAGLDASHVGTAAWNPLRDLVLTDPLAGPKLPQRDPGRSSRRPERVARGANELV